MAITAAAGAAAGTSPPAPVFQTGSTDATGECYIGTGTPSASNGILATFTFAGNYTATPTTSVVQPRGLVVSVSLPTTANGIGPYVASATTRQFVVSCTGTPPFNLPATLAGGIVVNWNLNT